MPQEPYKILYVCQEIAPYIEESERALLCRGVVQGMQERGHEIRTFMPRYGIINERRNQLHEVIRLSGMNLIIEDNDHQLIIKVASIPSARIQVYFIDNDDFFQRKATLLDEQGLPFEDNYLRTTFYARGVLETVKKLRWTPTIIHLQGWFAGMIPATLRDIFADEPLFLGAKIVVTIDQKDLDFAALKEPTADSASGASACERVLQSALSLADGVILHTDQVAEAIQQLIQERNLPILEAASCPEGEIAAAYEAFYQTILASE